MMICCAATPGLSRRDERVLLHTAAADARSREGDRDPGAAAPADDLAAPIGQTGVHAGRPVPARRTAPSPADGQVLATPASGPPGHHPALAPELPEASSRRCQCCTAARAPTHRWVDPCPGPAPGT